MKEKHLFFTILFALILFNSKSEIINGPANIRTAPNKKIIFSLKESVHVDCTEPKNEWYQIGITIKVSKKYYEQDLQIKKGQKLVNLKGDTIGEATEDIPFELCSVWTYGGSKGNPKVYGMNIYAYTHKDNIKTSSIPENMLIELIDQNKNNLSFINFENFITKFQLKKDDFLNQIYPTTTEYMIYENAIDDPSPLDRIKLIFENNKLLAIIHARTMPFNKVNSKELRRGLKISVFNSPENTDIDTFIKKCMIPYNEVD